MNKSTTFLVPESVKTSALLKSDDTRLNGKNSRQCAWICLAIATQPSAISYPAQRNNQLVRILCTAVNAYDRHLVPLVSMTVLALSQTARKAIDKTGSPLTSPLAMTNQSAAAFSETRWMKMVNGREGI